MEGGNGEGGGVTEGVSMGVTMLGDSEDRDRS